MDAAAGASDWRKRILNVPVSPTDLALHFAPQHHHRRSPLAWFCSSTGSEAAARQYSLGRGKGQPAICVPRLACQRCIKQPRLAAAQRVSPTPAPSSLDVVTDIPLTSPLPSSPPCSISSRLHEDVFGVVCGDRGPRNTMVMAECAVAAVASLLNRNCCLT